MKVNHILFEALVIDTVGIVCVVVGTRTAMSMFGFSN